MQKNASLRFLFFKRQKNLTKRPIIIWIAPNKMLKINRVNGFFVVFNHKGERLNSEFKNLLENLKTKSPKKLPYINPQNIVDIPQYKKSFKLFLFFLYFLKVKANPQAKTKIKPYPASENIIPKNV